MLEGERYLSLATYRKSGVAVETAVWFAEHAGRLYVFSARDAGKVKRLRASPRSRAAACDFRGRVHGEWYDAHTEIVEDPTTVAAAYAALHDKYGVLMGVSDFFSRLTGRYDARAMLEIELRPA